MATPFLAAAVSSELDSVAAKLVMTMLATSSSGTEVLFLPSASAQMT